MADVMFGNGWKLLRNRKHYVIYSIVGYYDAIHHFLNTPWPKFSKPPRGPHTGTKIPAFPFVCRFRVEDGCVFFTAELQTVDEFRTKLLARIAELDEI
jgi:hypothetical protein